MENTPQQNSEGTAVVRVLATVLERLVKANANLSNSGQGQVTKFHALKAPGISILQYLERIYKYASCSTECFILALIYIDRLIQKHNFVLTELNVHRVVITSILLAAKFFDDAYYNNAYYAKVGGVLVSEMNGLEVEFLFRINFSLHVKPDEFAQYQASLVSHAVGADPISERTVVCKYATSCEASASEVSQPPSPQAMSSQSTSPSMSPRNDCSNEEEQYYVNQPVSQHPKVWTSDECWTRQLQGNDMAHCTQKTLPAGNPVVESCQEKPTLELSEYWTRLLHKEHPGLVKPCEILSRPPGELYSNSNKFAQPMNRITSEKVWTSNSAPGETLNTLPIRERRIPSLTRYNSFPHSTHTETLVPKNDVDMTQNNWRPNIPSAKATTGPLRQQPNETFFSSCSHYGRHNINLGFVNKPLPSNVANIM